MTTSATEKAAFSPLAQSIGLRDSVAERVLVAILEGSIKAGDRLVGQKLAAQLGVSATPVREALIELGTLGFVELQPNRGAVCVEFGPTELSDIFQIRRILEAEAACGACGNVPTQELEELKARMLTLSQTVETDADWSNHAMAADHDLHKVIRQYCSNKRLTHEIDRYNILMRAIRRVAGNLYNVQLRAVTQHLQIIKALLAEDAELTREYVNLHIESTAQGVAKVMFRQEEGLQPND